MGLLGPENPQLPRGFADRDRTSETAENAKIGLLPASVSFHPNLAGKGSDLKYIPRLRQNPKFLVSADPEVI